MWIDTLGAKLAQPASGDAGVRAGAQQARRRPAEHDAGDLVDPPQRDQDQRDQQDGAEPEREGGAGRRNSGRSNSRTRSPTQAPTAWAATASSSTCIKVAPAMPRIGSDTSTPTATAMAPIFQCGRYR